MIRRFGLPVALVLAVLSVVSAGASSQRAAVKPAAEARAYAIQVVVPGAAGATGAVVTAPPDHASVGSAFAYPPDNPVITAGALSSSAFATPGSSSTASAAGEVSSLSLFGGEITADRVSARLRATASGANASGDSNGARVTGLVALGQPVGAAPGTSIALADWGSLSVLGGSTSKTTLRGAAGYHQTLIAVHVHLTADHGGLPAGTDVFVGYAETTVQAGTPAAQTRKPTAPPVRKGPPAARDAEKDATADKRAPGLSVIPERRVPPDVHPKLTAGRYVFPVYGPVSFVDSFGAGRAAPVTWHHGDDIFAPLGAPVLAVADGTLFSVGWNDIGGLRLWLRDGDGNEFYYAHLSAFSTRAYDGAAVRAGDVVGFIGNTGDAEGTPYHLHFEIHPVSMLYLGYDGVVNPTKYLEAWERLRDVPISGVSGWAPFLGIDSAAPKPGAVLLQATDISSASGLDPASLRRALRARLSPVADGSLRQTAATAVRVR